MDFAQTPSGIPSGPHYLPPNLHVTRLDFKENLERLSGSLTILTPSFPRFCLSFIPTSVFFKYRVCYTLPLIMVLQYGNETRSRFSLYLQINKTT